MHIDTGFRLDYRSAAKISHWVSSVLDLDNLLELIIIATKMMQAKASSLVLLDPKTKLYLRWLSEKGRKSSEV
jgi:hypothetical protein